MKLPNNVYDILKWVCIIFLPALSTAYSALAGIWDLPFAEQIPATLTVIALFIGALIGVSSAQYNKGAGDG